MGDRKNYQRSGEFSFVMLMCWCTKRRNRLLSVVTDSTSQQQRALVSNTLTVDVSEARFGEHCTVFKLFPFDTNAFYSYSHDIWTLEVLLGRAKRKKNWWTFTLTL